MVRRGRPPRRTSDRPEAQPSKLAPSAGCEREALARASVHGRQRTVPVPPATGAAPRPSWAPLLRLGLLGEEAHRAERVLARVRVRRLVERSLGTLVEDARLSWCQSHRRTRLGSTPTATCGTAYRGASSLEARSISSSRSSSTAASSFAPSGAHPDHEQRAQSVIFQARVEVDPVHPAPTIAPVVRVCTLAMLGVPRTPPVRRTRRRASAASPRHSRCLYERRGGHCHAVRAQGACRGNIRARQGLLYSAAS